MEKRAHSSHSDCTTIKIFMTEFCMLVAMQLLLLGTMLITYIVDICKLTTDLQNPVTTNSSVHTKGAL